MQYEVYGPFVTPRFQRGFTGEAVKGFWTEVENTQEGLSKSVGVYVFSIWHGDNLTPWYIGKTCAKGGFRSEVFQTHKLNHYISAAERKRGYPTLHLIPRVEPTRGRFCRPSELADRDIDALETAMIAMALQTNPSVRNSKKTWFVRNCKVPGLLGSKAKGRRPEAVSTLRNAFGLD